VIFLAKNWLPFRLEKALYGALKPVAMTLGPLSREVGQRVAENMMTSRGTCRTPLFSLSLSGFGHSTLTQPCSMLAFSASTSYVHFLLGRARRQFLARFIGSCIFFLH
jgi:hypothetical protein